MSAIPLSNAERSPSRLSIRDAYNRFYGDWSPDLSPRSKERHRFDLMRWEKLMGVVYVLDLSTAHYQTFRRLSREAGHSAGTTETTLKTIKAIASVCHANGVLRVIPHHGKPRRIPPPNPHVPNIDDMQRFYEATDRIKLTWPRTHLNPRDWWKCCICLAVWTGLRKSDLLHTLAWEHVEHDRITYVAQKTDHVHTFPIVPTVKRHLDFLHRPGRKLVLGCVRNSNKLQENLEKLSVAAHITPYVSMQVMRRFAITNWSRADSQAGSIIHGSGLGILKHYLDQQQLLDSVAEDVELPPAMLAFGSGGETQLTLF